jgi:DEAD/DEAH box helicase domain-containing protein
MDVAIIYVLGPNRACRNKQILDTVDLETAPWERQTTGAWIDVPKETITLLLTHDINPAEAIHAAQHAFLNRFAMAADLRTECKPVCICETMYLHDS